MKVKNDEQPVEPGTDGDQKVACTVLITGTTYGDVELAKGARLRLPKKDAETLAALTPPAVQITGL